MTVIIYALVGALFVIALFVGYGAYHLGYAKGQLSEMRKPAYNSKAGSQIIQDSDTIRFGLGTVKHHREQIEVLGRAIQGHEEDIDELLDHIQLEAKQIKDASVRWKND